MKIILSVSSIGRGGIERQVFLTAKSLLKYDYEIDLLAFRYSKDNYIDEYNFDIKRLHIIDSELKSQKITGFKNVLDKIKPDILIAYDFQTALLSFLFARRFKCVFINASIQHGIRQITPFQMLRSILCYFSPYVIANSYAGLRANGLRENAAQNFVLYNGIEEKFLKRRTDSEAQRMRQNLFKGFKENPGIVFITVANFVTYKDYETVFKALSQFKNEKKFYYIIIGDGPYRSEIERSILKYNLSENILLIGRISNVEEYLSVADVMIHSSKGEGISNSIVEGMYAGLPVIATNVGGIPETVFPESSMLFSYKDANELHKCLLASDELMLKFDPTSEKYNNFLKKFSVETMINRFNEIINTVLKMQNKELNSFHHI
jgi:glycosyltransferase involved in cell wall biosynthesis